MGADNARRDCFPRDQVILVTDRRVKVSDKQKSTFPFNLIGQIQSRERYGKQNQSFSNAKGTGYLISQRLVATSSHNFVIRDQTNGEVKQFIPLSFSLQQQGTNGLFLKSSNIKRFMINTKFVGILNQIVRLKKMYYSGENDDKLQNRLEKDILVLETEAIQHDFALLVLQQKFDRPQYFQLLPNLAYGSKLTVTGYDDSNCLFTHSNILSQINKGGIFYDIDTMAGQSGCPVYLSGDPKKVVGIHKGYDPLKHLNFATMITEEIISFLKVWAKEMKVSIGDVKEQPRTSKIIVPATIITQSMSGDNINKQTLITQVNELWKKGDSFKNQGQLQEAFKCYSRALTVFQKVKKKEQIGWAITLYNIGDVYYNQRKPQQALECYKKALLIFDKLGKETIEWANTLNNIGLVYYNQDKFEQALEYDCRALTIHERLGKDSIEQANTLHNIGNVYDQSQPTLALEYYNRALIIFEKIKSPSIQWANTLCSIANVYQTQGLHQKASQFFAKSKAMKVNLK